MPTRNSELKQVSTASTMRYYLCDKGYYMNGGTSGSNVNYLDRGDADEYERVCMYNIFLDAFKTPYEANDFFRRPNRQWNRITLVIQTYDAFKDLILDRGLPTWISFGYRLSNKKTTIDCMTWLTGYCGANDLPLPKIAVHSKDAEAKMILKIMDYHNGTHRTDK